MSTLLQAPRPERSAVEAFSEIVTLGDEETTTIHAVRYDRSEFAPKIVRFMHETRLLDWCEDNEVDEAVVGGFFLRSSHQLLGETWIDGQQQKTLSFIKPWHKVRGSLHINPQGTLNLGPRNAFPRTPLGSLLQTGPLLVHNSIPLIEDGKDIEGLTAGASQFDSDITDGRHPRAAIGTDEKHIWSVVCDGRSPNDAGLSLRELAEVMVDLGAKEALNLDGGGSASQVSGGKLLNHSRGDGKEYPRGRPIYTAIIFEPR